MNTKKIVLICAATAVGCFGTRAVTAVSDSTLAVTPVVAQAGDSVATPTIHNGMMLTLDDCINIALSDNPTIRVADMDIERVDYTRWETISQLLPQISFAGSYNRMIAKQVTYMNMDFDKIFGALPGLGGGDSGAEGGVTDVPEAAASRASSEKKKDDGIKVGLDNSYQVGFSATIPIIMPQLWASLKLSDAQILMAVEQSRASKLDLINNIKSAYYTLMLAYDSKKVIQESYDMAAFTHDMYVKQQSLGAASDFDVLRTSVAMKNIEPSLMQADIAIKQAKLQLRILMGLESNFDFTIAGTLADYEKTMYADVMNINTDYSENTQLVLNDIQTKQLNQALKIQKAAYYPTLVGVANYNWTSSTNGSPFSYRWNPFSIVGLQLNVPLFTGGQRYAKVKQAEIQLEEMKWNRANLDRSIQMQVDLAVDNIKMNVKQISSCSESVGQATRAHDIMQQSFKIGAASYLNLRDSELALTQSQLAYYQAIYNYLVAQSQLELLLGTAKHVDVPQKYQRYQHNY